jgi:L-histidine N-alpha-methyltransferase
VPAARASGDGHAGRRPRFFGVAESAHRGWRRPALLFYPGSSIGNFTPAEALAFLRQVHAACLGGALLIGVDLVKPVGMLEPAYDDPLGVTAAFNRNMLLHLNRLAGS